MTRCHLATALLLTALLTPAAPAADPPSDLRGFLRTVLLDQSAAAPAPAPDPGGTPGVFVRRQDHGRLCLNRSVRDDIPIQIGKQIYKNGLGTHANSEIVVTLPEPAARFEADVGVDNNWDTAGQRGTVVFTVEAGGKELFRSGLCRGGEQPVAVKLDLSGARTFTLRASDGGDGTGWDQCDWAAATVTYVSGRRQRLDELPVRDPAAQAGFAAAVPFSFVYHGKPSSTFLSTWKG